MIDVSDLMRPVAAGVLARRAEEASKRRRAFEAAHPLLWIGTDEHGLRLPIQSAGELVHEVEKDLRLRGIQEVTLSLSREGHLTVRGMGTSLDAVRKFLRHEFDYRALFESERPAGDVLPWT